MNTSGTGRLEDKVCIDIVYLTLKIAIEFIRM